MTPHHRTDTVNTRLELCTAVEIDHLGQVRQIGVLLRLHVSQESIGHGCLPTLRLAIEIGRGKCSVGLRLGQGGSPSEFMAFPEVTRPISATRSRTRNE